MAKSVKVHDDTHRALKELKARRRSKSVDQVIRDIIAAATGTRVETVGKEKPTRGLASFSEE